MSTSAAVPGFLPSLHGFRFANRWPPGPTITFGPFDPRVIGIGDASTGLCGGMVTTARDLFEAGIAMPSDTDPPANGSPRFRAIVRRQVESLDWLRTPLRFFDLQAFRPDPTTGIFGFLHREPPRVVAVRDEWPRIRTEIAGGHAPILGLIRASSSSPRDLTRNHQVLAYAYEEDAGGFRIRIYDPNHPGTRRRRAPRDRRAPARARGGRARSRSPSRRASRCSASSGRPTPARARWPPGAESRAPPSEAGPVESLP